MFFEVTGDEGVLMLDFDLTDAVRNIEHDYPEFKFISYGGFAPVQAFGKFGSKFFYFRFRGDYASLTVGDTNKGDYVHEGVTFEVDDYLGDAFAGALTPDEFQSLFNILASQALQWAVKNL